MADILILLVGYRFMALLPEQKKGMVMLVNANHFTGQATRSEVSFNVTNRMSGNPPAWSFLRTGLILRARWEPIDQSFIKLSRLTV